jgi:hypothetical protein
VSVLGLFLLRCCRGLEGGIPDDGKLSGWVLIGYGVHLLMIVIVPTGV